MLSLSEQTDGTGFIEILYDIAKLLLLISNSGGFATAENLICRFQPEDPEIQLILALIRSVCDITDSFCPEEQRFFKVGI